MWLGTLLMERSDDIYRMKGLLSVDGMPERFVFQVCVVLLTLLLRLIVCVCPAFIVQMQFIMKVWLFSVCW